MSLQATLRALSDPVRRQILELLKAQMPELNVQYEVSLGGKHVSPDTRELVLENGDYDFFTMMANLIYLPKMESIQLKMPQLSMGQMEELAAAYERLSSGVNTATNTNIGLTVEAYGEYIER